MTGGGEECAAQGLCAPAEWCEWEAAGAFARISIQNLIQSSKDQF